jgi:hypothetical protein
VVPPDVHIRPLSVAVEQCHYDVARKTLASRRVEVHRRDLRWQAADGGYYVLDDEKSKRERMRALLAK